MLLEVDEVAVERDMWQWAQSGDTAAIAQLRKLIDGLDIYTHCLSVSDTTHIAVTLRELDSLNLIRGVRIYV